jgi:hypothetical protein
MYVPETTPVMSAVPCCPRTPEQVTANVRRTAAELETLVEVRRPPSRCPTPPVLILILVFVTHVRTTNTPYMQTLSL